MDKKYNFIDLFAGCGGMSEGFYKEDFNALIHVEINSAACKTLATRMKHYGYKDVESAVMELDITNDDVINKIGNSVKESEVDLVIGGPPCQSFSTLGRAKDDNGMKNDPRNFLFESYIKVLNNFKPKVFVFENVTGLLTAKIGDELIINRILKELRINYKVMSNPKEMVLNSVNYGVPQIRKRVIIIGVRKDINISVEEVYNGIKKTYFAPDEKDYGNLKKFVTVKDAISDLPHLNAGEGKSIMPFKSVRNNEYLKIIRSEDDNTLMDHVCRKHNSMDIERYAAMSYNKWSFSELLENRPDLRHPKKRVFNNSYVVQWWDLPSKTIIAHLYKDGNQFIHPDHKQGRTITVREAARLQSFPDDFIFEGPRTEQYKQIGNAVPPLLSHAIAKSIKKVLTRHDIIR